MSPYPVRFLIALLLSFGWQANCHAQQLRPAEAEKAVNNLNKDCDDALKVSPAKAQKLAQQAIFLAEKYNYRKGKVKALNNMGRAYYFLSDYDSAEVFYKNALDLASKIGEVEIQGTIYNNIGAVYSARGNNNSAIEFFFKAKQLGRSTGNHKLMGNALVNIGAMYELNELYDKALESYKEAEKAYGLTNNEKLKPGLYILLGNVYDYKGNISEARRYYLLALDLSRKLNDLSNVALCLNNIGDIFRRNDYLQEALLHYTESLNIRKKLGDKKGMAAASLNIGDLYMQMGNYEIAKIYTAEGLELAHQIGATDNILDGYLAMSKIDEKNGDLRGALNFLKRYNSYSAQTKSFRNFDKMAEIEGLYKIEQQEDSIKLLTKDKAINELKLKEKNNQNEQSRLLNTLLIAIISFITIIVIIMLNSIRLQRKANISLEEKSNQILRQRDDLHQKNDLINHQIELVQAKNKEITDSINYAQRIQRTLLPLETRLRDVLTDHFVFYQPRDIVSGDFYWFAQSGPNIILALGDCVGHGVPGAFMTVMGNALLNEIVIEKDISEPVKIVSELNKKVYSSLRSHASDPDAGGDMDIAVVKIIPETKTLYFTGAKIAANLVRNGEVNQIKPDKFSIGSARETEVTFTQHGYQYQSGDMLFLSSDGYADQFGGENSKKFMTKNFRELLCAIASKSCWEQKVIIENRFYTWKGTNHQTDDVLVMGVRL